MFATCVFCNGSLERNEAIEAFPVGSRLAFDAARGRLWVVCRSCERWNLTPLDERWEAIEQAERLYRDTRKRVTTDNIGLAKAADGTSLIRIGEPLRPEFAAWRYGDQFGRRRRRQILIAGGGMAALGGVFIGGAIAGVAVASFGGVISQLGSRIINGSPEGIAATIRAPDGQIMKVRRRHLAETAVTHDGNGMVVDLRFKGGARRFEGSEAQRVAGIIVPKVNRYGGKRQQIAEAVQQIEDAGTPERFVEDLARAGHVIMRVPKKKKKSRWSDHSDYVKFGLFSVPAPRRLALEMALHEEAERRALQGELAELERAWREAEEIAAIADDLLLPEGVRAKLDDLKKTR
jgi:hypothetical protein